ncbi:Alpha/Beta hydrolase protein, partial [Trichophaea hybrida]
DSDCCSVVAVTGLAGHPFGSWRSRLTNRMWLQDFLRKEIPNIRILTYGYNSQLVGPNSTEFRMLDHRRHFVQELRNSRSSIAKRPIIFLGHSLGGILVLQTLLQCKNQILNRDLFDLTSAIFFFGTPHNGLHTAELEAMVNDMASKPESTASILLQQLRQGSEFLESQADELVDIWPGRRIVSFYELLETPTVRRVGLLTGFHGNFCFTSDNQS